MELLVQDDLLFP
jgi:hypothetical protein